MGVIQPTTEGAIAQPDADFFNGLNAEVSDKGFLVVGFIYEWKKGALEWE